MQSSFPELADEAYVFLWLRAHRDSLAVPTCPLADAPHTNGQAAWRQEFALRRKLCGQLAQRAHRLGFPCECARVTHLARGTKKAAQRRTRQTAAYAHALHAES